MHRIHRLKVLCRLYSSVCCGKVMDHNAIFHYGLADSLYYDINVQNVLKYNDAAV